MKSRIIFIILFFLLSCSKKENVGIIVTLSDNVRGMYYGKVTGVISAHVNWIDGDENVKRILLLPDTPTQIVVPEGTMIDANIELVSVDLNTSEQKKSTIYRRFVAVKNNPSWNLP